MARLCYVTRQTSRWLDRESVESFHIPSLLLMENAAIALAHYARAEGDSHGLRHFLVVAGKGNNGGDGIAAARHLSNHGCPVTIFLASDPRDLEACPDAALQLRIARTLPIALVESKDPDQLDHVIRRFPDRSFLVIDALFGTGLQGPLRPPYDRIIRTLNQESPFTVAADIPSGLDADSGEIHTEAIRARLTVTFGFPKLGFLLGSGPDLVGRVVVGDISLPLPLRKKAEEMAEDSREGDGT